MEAAPNDIQIGVVIPQNRPQSYQVLPGDYSQSNLNTTNNFIQNQGVPTQTQLLESSIKSMSTLIKCPHCAFLTPTYVVNKCNPLNILCCLCFGLVAWGTFQILRKKDLNCYDANHFCPNCKNRVGTYTSC